MTEVKQSSHYLDLASLDQMRQRAQDDPNASLREVAQQFEGIFMGMMLKSMRDANEAFKDSDSPFHSQHTEFYQQMHDSQMVSEMSSQGSLGLAELIVQQLGEQPKASDAMQAEGFMPLTMPTRPKGLSELADSQQVDDSVAPLLVSPASTGERIGDMPQHTAATIETKPLVFTQPQQFVQAMLPAAEEAGKKLGQDPRILVAQAALETGWGRKILPGNEGQSSHNLFNIKADKRWDGASTQINALEYEDNLPVLKRSSFRVYEDLKASFDDYVEFLQQPRYREALAASTPEGFAVALQQAGYATDPQYAAKIIDLFQRLSKQSLTP